MIPLEAIQQNYYKLKIKLTLTNLVFLNSYILTEEVTFSVNSSLKTEVSNNTVDVSNAVTEFNATLKKGVEIPEYKITPVVGMKINNTVQNWRERLDFTLLVDWNFYEIGDERKHFPGEPIPDVIDNLTNTHDLKFDFTDACNINYFKNNYAINKIISKTNVNLYTAKLAVENKTAIDYNQKKVFDSQEGVDGILINPYDKWQNEFVWNIQISNINYSVSQITLIPQKTYEVISVPQLNFAKASEYVINYQLNAWNKFLENQQDLALKFIKAHEKQL
ncbi:hypothetical protein SCLARK_00428 [Spiroplasma clarkii]|nr:hypothetical protein SCLARK_00428 [Spiroplasma clarkii]